MRSASSIGWKKSRQASDSTISAGARLYRLESTAVLSKLFLWGGWRPAMPRNLSWLSPSARRVFNSTASSMPSKDPIESPSNASGVVPASAAMSRANCCASIVSCASLLGMGVPARAERPQSSTATTSSHGGSDALEAHFLNAKDEPPAKGKQ